MGAEKIGHLAHPQIDVQQLLRHADDVAVSIDGGFDVGGIDALPDEPLKSAARLAKQSGQSLFNEYIWRRVRASFGKFRFDVREVRQETGKAALDNQQRKLWQAQGRIPELVRSRQDAADTLPPDVAGVLTSLAQNARSETVRLSADQLDAALKVLAEDKSASSKPLTRETSTVWVSSGSSRPVTNINLRPESLSRWMASRVS